MAPPSRMLAFLAVAAGGCALDLTTKSWIFEKLGMPGAKADQVLWLWPGVFSLTTSLNQGALFGFGQGFVAVFAAASIIAALFIIYWLFVQGAAKDWALTLTLALISAGIAGNLYDRLGLPDLSWPGQSQRVYAVRDWLHFKIDHVIDWPVFNLADSYLVCGAVLLFWYVWTTQPKATGEKPPVGERTP